MRYAMRCTYQRYAARNRQCSACAPDAQAAHIAVGRARPNGPARGNVPIRLRRAEPPQIRSTLVEDRHGRHHAHKSRNILAIRNHHILIGPTICAYESHCLFLPRPKSDFLWCRLAPGSDYSGFLITQN